MTDAFLHVAVAQTAPQLGEVSANARQAAETIARAAEAGARLVLFPELSLNGYDLTALADRQAWVTAEDSRLDPIREVCQRSNITAIVGGAFRHDDARTLASLVMGPAGHLHVHGKRNLHGQERDLFQPGDASQIFNIDGWKIALAICYDAGVPSHAQEAAEEGADVYAVSALYTLQETRRLDVHLAARAMDHRMYTLAANLAGHGNGWQSCGGSGAWHPDGRRMIQAGAGPTVLNIELSRDELREIRDRDALAGYPKGEHAAR